MSEILRTVPLPLVELAVVAGLVAALVVVVLVRRGTLGRAGAARVLLAAALLVIASVTLLRPAGRVGAAGWINLVPLRSISALWTDPHVLPGPRWQIYGNALMLVPVGFLGALAARRVSWTAGLAWATGTAVVIETLQLVFALGSVDIDDVILAALGGAVGATLAVAARRMSRAWGISARGKHPAAVRAATGP
ncbi:VanZ family protein [Demequina soli]|uniref:VanZ family protein n=1 Tax=Demequina soli TaxID=1638987 RepID=UPI000783D309|nr:VanZ family protein [Demequina soli]